MMTVHALRYGVATRAGWVFVALFVTMCGSTVRAADEGAAKGESERVLHKEVVVPATLADVWRAWTTSAGMAEWWVSESRIKCEVLSPYELVLAPDEPEGRRGAETCRVLSYLPHEMLSFEWTFPPKIPSLRDAGEKTHVVLRFEEVDGGRVRVRFDQLGWGEGEDWDAGYAYSDEAWDLVLDRLRTHFEKRSARTESWIDGGVSVTAQYGPHQRQIFEVELAADVATAWHALTTRDGVRSFLSPNPRIEMITGGAYVLFPGSTAKVLGFVPRRQLVITGSAPLEFPNVRMDGTWAVIDLQAAGDDATVVTMTCLGWQSGGEWDRAFEYFLKNNPVFLNLLRQRFSEGPLEWSAAAPGEHPTFTRTGLK